MLASRRHSPLPVRAAPVLPAGSQEAHPSNPAARRGPSPRLAFMEEPHLAVPLTKPGAEEAAPAGGVRPGRTQGIPRQRNRAAIPGRETATGPGSVKKKKQLWYLPQWQSRAGQLIQGAARGDGARPARPLAAAHGPGRLVPTGRPCPRLRLYSAGGNASRPPEGNSSPERSCSPIQVICIRRTSGPQPRAALPGNLGRPV